MCECYKSKSANEKIIKFAVHDIRERSPLILTPMKVSCNSCLSFGNCSMCWFRVVVKLNKMAGNFEFPRVLSICCNLFRLLRNCFVRRSSVCIVISWMIHLSSCTKFSLGLKTFVLICSFLSLAIFRRHSFSHITRWASPGHYSALFGTITDQSFQKTKGHIGSCFSAAEVLHAFDLAPPV